MRAFGHRPLASITSAEIARFLARLDAEPSMGARTVNKHCQVLASVLEHAMRPDTFGLLSNPARATDKRREPDDRQALQAVHADVRADGLVEARDDVDLDVEPLQSADEVQRLLHRLVREREVAVVVSIDVDPSSERGSARNMSGGGIRCDYDKQVNNQDRSRAPR